MFKVGLLGVGYIANIFIFFTLNSYLMVTLVKQVLQLILLFH